MAFKGSWGPSSLLVLLWLLLAGSCSLNTTPAHPPSEGGLVKTLLQWAKYDSPHKPIPGTRVSHISLSIGT